MARGRRTVSRMEKLWSAGPTTVASGSSEILTYQLDGGEVEAQVKRIMLSFGVESGKLCNFNLGLFQKEPTALSAFDDETTVISGAIGNQFAHNETITMRVPKDWWIALAIINNGASSAQLTRSLQLNYKVLN